MRLLTKRVLSLQEEPFTEEFKTVTQSFTGAKCEYGLIPREHWVQPYVLYHALNEDAELIP